MKPNKFQIGDEVQLDPSYKNSTGYMYIIPKEEYNKIGKVVSLTDIDHVRLDTMIAGFRSWHVDAIMLKLIEPIEHLEMTETHNIIL